MHELVCDEKFFHFCWGNHILNLIVKVDLEKVNEAIVKIREDVNHIKNLEERI